MAYAGAGAAIIVAVGEARSAPAAVAFAALSLSLQLKLKESLLLEKLETSLLPHMRTAPMVMMAMETLLMTTRAALSLTLAIIVVAVVVADERQALSLAAESCPADANSMPLMDEGCTAWYKCLSQKAEDRPIVACRAAEQTLQRLSPTLNVVAAVLLL